MAASLRSTRSVAKAVLPNRMGRLIIGSPAVTLTVNGSGGISFRCGGQSLSLPAQPEAVTLFAVRRDKPNVRYVTRACEGHTKQYQIRYNNVDSIPYARPRE